MQITSIVVSCCLLQVRRPLPVRKQFLGRPLEQHQKQLVLLVIWTVGQRSQGSVRRMLVILEWSAGLSPKMLVNIAHGASPPLSPDKLNLAHLPFCKVSLFGWSQVPLFKHNFPWSNGVLKGVSLHHLLLLSLL